CFVRWPVRRRSAGTAVLGTAPRRDSAVGKDGKRQGPNAVPFAQTSAGRLCFSRGRLATSGRGAGLTNGRPQPPECPHRNSFLNTSRCFSRHRCWLELLLLYSWHCSVMTLRRSFFVSLRSDFPAELC